MWTLLLITRLYIFFWNVFCLFSAPKYWSSKMAATHFTGFIKNSSNSYRNYSAWFKKQNGPTAIYLIKLKKKKIDNLGWFGWFWGSTASVILESFAKRHTKTKKENDVKGEKERKRYKILDQSPLTIRHRYSCNLGYSNPSGKRETGEAHCLERKPLQGHTIYTRGNNYLIGVIAQYIVSLTTVYKDLKVLFTAKVLNFQPLPRVKLCEQRHICMKPFEKEKHYLRAQEEATAAPDHQQGKINCTTIVRKYTFNS